MKKICIYLFLTTIFFVDVFCAESFVKPKAKNKKVSTSKVKEKIADQYAEIQSEVGSILKTHGEFLEQMVVDMRSLLEGTKGEFFSSAKSYQLQNYLDHLQNLHEDLKSDHCRIKEHQKRLHNKKNFD